MLLVSLTLHVVFLTLHLISRAGGLLSEVYRVLLQPVQSSLCVNHLLVQPFELLSLFNQVCSVRHPGRLKFFLSLALLLLGGLGACLRLLHLR